MHTEHLKNAGYTRYNFAMYSGGQYCFFDLLRYDRAFLASFSEVIRWKCT